MDSLPVESDSYPAWKMAVTIEELCDRFKCGPMIRCATGVLGSTMVLMMEQDGEQRAKLKAINERGTN